MFEDLLYLPLDMEAAPRDCLSKLNDINFQNIIRDEYRNCWHVPLMWRVNGIFTWSPISKEFPSLVQWVEDVVIPIVGKSRMMIIATPSGTVNPPHIDCSPKMFPTLQHKFRFVLQGNVDDLVFMSSSGDMYLEKTLDKPFVMSGKWPHYMINTHTDTKFTFSCGASHKFEKLSNKAYKDLLISSNMLYNDYYVNCTDVDLPLDYEKYYEEKYR